MAFKDSFLRFNAKFARVLVAVLSPILLGLLWLTVGAACLLPRLFGTRFLILFRRGGTTHWLEHEPVDTSLRGLRRQG